MDERAAATSPSARVAAPASTYRIQLRDGIDFRKAAALVSYLSRLGIDDCYCSPCLAARPGSRHGYDVADHTRADPELGGEDGFRAFSDELRRHGMGLLLDFVPNHMAVDARTNPWWRDVLENGPASPFARFFDIDWDPIKPELKGKILLPILGGLYGEVLERGELRLELRDGMVRLRYFDHALPIHPREAARVFGHDLERLGADLAADDFREYADVVAHLEALPRFRDPRAREETVRAEQEALVTRLRRLVDSVPGIREHVEASLRRFNGEPGDAASFDPLHDLVEALPFRLAYWRTASHEINYRRFFDINELAGVRVEDGEVFAATHSLVLGWIREGRVSGLRLDHVDGLFDPQAYLNRLREAAGSVYVVAEKILTAGEELREDWQLEGTTGYDFLNELNAVFVDPRHGLELRRAYHRFTGRRAPFPIVAYVGKKLIIETTMGSEVNVLAHSLNRISERNRKSRDFTLESLKNALTEVVACFPSYRTYIAASGASESDSITIDSAIHRARRRNPAVERAIFDFVQSALIASGDGTVSAEDRRSRLGFAMKFQQYTGPVQAKGVEDTAFYRYNLLLSLNEVGGDPQRYARPPSDFHAANLRRLERWPRTMLASSTHDTKRGEDARARLNVLSEVPREWRRMISTWSRSNAHCRTRLGGEWAPDRNDEYLYYQSLLGV
ncbi:MAG: malto-oligosyltrehalose synthase, partial [Candidatus Binatia bacterium]